MGPTPFEFVGNPAPLGEAAPRGGGETAPRTIAFSDAERFLLLWRAPEADERILTDSSDASKPAGSPDARSGAESQIQLKEWPMTDGMRHLPCDQAMNSNHP